MSKKPVAVTLRKPQAPAEVDTFVSGVTGDSAPLSPPAPPSLVVTTAEVQHAARNYREMTLYLPTEVARELSFYCMDRNCDINRVVAEAVGKHVSPNPPEASAPQIDSLRGALEAVVEQSRVRIRALWPLRRWVD